MSESRKNDVLILEKLQDLSDRFIKYETEVKSVLFSKDGNKGLCEKVADQEKKINKIENNIAKWSGGAVVVSIFIMWILNKVFAAIK